MSQKITPNLWFDTEAEEAARFYVDVFPDGRIHSVSRYPEGAPGTAGEVMTVEWEVMGMRFIGINGRLMFETWVQMAGLLESGALDPRPVITHKLPLRDAERAVAMMTSPDRDCGKVVLEP